MQCIKPVLVNHNIVVSHKKLAKKPNNGQTSHHNVRVKTLNDCRICISQYNFVYNAEGGKGIGSYIKTKEDEHYGSYIPITYDFDLETVHFPPLTTMTTSLDGWIMFPPLVKVEVVPQRVQGHVYGTSGKVEFKLESKFVVSIGSSYKAPPMLIDMKLTTEELKGTRALLGGRKIKRGTRLGKDGKCLLVGVAKIDPIDDTYINHILGLPSECFASVRAIMSFY